VESREEGTMNGTSSLLVTGGCSMNRSLLVLLVPVGIVTGSLPLLARAQCTKDSDCKGERICVDGHCTAPGKESGSTSRKDAKSESYTMIRLAEARQARSQWKAAMITGFVVGGLFTLAGAICLGTHDDGPIRGLGYGGLAGGTLGLIFGIVGAAVYPGKADEVRQLERKLGVEAAWQVRPPAMPPVSRNSPKLSRSTTNSFVLGWSGTF